MGTKAALLDIPGAVLIKVIQPRLPNPDDFWVLGKIYQLFGRDLRLFFRLMGVNANRAPHFIMCISDITYNLEFTNLCADRHQGSNPGPLRGSHNLIQVAPVALQVI